MMGAPGGSETHHIINKNILEALGPNGFLINIAWGYLIDEPEMINTLSQSKIADAALDVFSAEPRIAQDLKMRENTVLTPHRGPATTETVQEIFMLAMANLFAAEKGQELLTPVE